MTTVYFVPVIPLCIIVVVCGQYPMETYGYAFLFSLSGYLGVNFVLTLIKSLGALVAVTGRGCFKIDIVHYPLF